MWYNKKCRESLDRRQLSTDYKRMLIIRLTATQADYFFLLLIMISAIAITQPMMLITASIEIIITLLCRNSTKVCEFNLLPNQCGDGREVYRLFYTSEMVKVTPTYSLQAILQHFCQNKSSYFEICHISQNKSNCIVRCGIFANIKTHKL